MTSTVPKFLILLTALGTLSACQAKEENVTILDQDIVQTRANAPHPTRVSNANFSVTEIRLRDAIKKRGLKLFAVIDHGEGAKSVGQDIGLNKLFIFGNPKAGTPLMIADPKMGLDLPMKMLIYTSHTDQVKISYTDISHPANMHNLVDQEQRLKIIAGTMRKIFIETAE